MVTKIKKLIIANKNKSLAFLLLSVIVLTLPVIMLVSHHKESSNTNVSAAGAPPPIHVQGNKIVTDSGQPVMLRGVDRSGAEYSCVQSHTVFDGATDATAVQAIANWKVNVVRVPLNEDCWLGINGANPGGTTYQQAIINYINLLNQYGMYVIVDLHWNAPGTQLSTGQQDMADADHGVAFWTSVATAFKGNNTVIFDLYNEPRWNIAMNCWLNGGSASACGEPFNITGMQQMLNAVRGTGATNMVLAGFTGWNFISQWLNYKPQDPLNNVVAGFHAYGNQMGGCPNSCLDTNVAPLMTQVPVIVGEFGESFDSTVCSTSWESGFVQWLESHQAAGYLAWRWAPYEQTCAGLSLLTDWYGTPKDPNGTWYKSWLSQVVTSTTTIVTEAPTSAPTIITPSWVCGGSGQGICPLNVPSTVPEGSTSPIGINMSDLPMVTDAPTQPPLPTAAISAPSALSLNPTPGNSGKNSGIISKFIQFILLILQMLLQLFKI
jgi:hypothetical protein